MLKVAYLAVPKYLSNPILSSIAKEIHKFGMNYYIDTNEEPPEEHVPENFDMILRINRELVTKTLENMRAHNIIKTIKSVRKLRRHVIERMNFLNPDAIVATSDMGGLITRLCNEWAVKYKRPFFIMQPSFLEVAPETVKERVSRLMIYSLFNKLLKTPIGKRQHYACNERKTNYNLLWGPEFANQVKSKRVAQNTFYVGNPLLDKFANVKVRIDVKNPFAVICTQPYDKLADMGILKLHQALEMIVMLTQMVIQNPNVYFYIKVHPSEDERKYEKLFKEADVNTDNFQIRKDMPIQEMLKLVDVQISMSSYTSFEAVVAGVPIIILHPEFVNFFNQFEGIGQNVSDIEHFNVTLRRLLRKLGRKCFEIQRLNYLDKKLSYFGDSANRTAVIIKMVIECQKPKFK